MLLYDLINIINSMYNYRLIDHFSLKDIFPKHLNQLDLLAQDDLRKKKTKKHTRLHHSPKNLLDLSKLKLNVSSSTLGTLFD